MIYCIECFLEIQGNIKFIYILVGLSYNKYCLLYLHIVQELWNNVS